MSYIKNEQPDIFASATLSNANIIEKVIPQMKKKLKTLSQRAYMGEDGVPRYADGSVIPNAPRLQ